MATNKKTPNAKAKQLAEKTPAGWAAEKARAMAGNERSAGRFARLADVLLSAETQGQRRLSFAEANKRAGLQRGERGDPAASWRLALQRTRQLVPLAWRVDAEAGALVRDE